MTVVKIDVSTYRRIYGILYTVHKTLNSQRRGDSGGGEGGEGCKGGGGCISSDVLVSAATDCVRVLLPDIFVSVSSACHDQLAFLGGVLVGVRGRPGCGGCFRAHGADGGG